MLKPVIIIEGRTEPCDLVLDGLLFLSQFKAHAHIAYPPLTLMHWPVT